MAVLLSHIQASGMGGGEQVGDVSGRLEALELVSHLVDVDAHGSATAVACGGGAWCWCVCVKVEMCAKAFGLSDFGGCAKVKIGQRSGVGVVVGSGYPLQAVAHAVRWIAGHIGQAH